eukprot:TRINITY_DN10290_c0_g1_i1.p1 TRINITY_DN10290_c0_g1~~TRINITY_DN10290_c0_g1_i1.p1  ORF type:complete len:1049 (+),score=303.76 TRINITY_DN10290_c0_g1_i1:92-3148(+)
MRPRRATAAAAVVGSLAALAPPPGSAAAAAPRGGGSRETPLLRGARAGRRPSLRHDRDREVRGSHFGGALTPLWRFPTAMDVIATPALYGDDVFIFGTDGRKGANTSNITSLFPPDIPDQDATVNWYYSWPHWRQGRLDEMSPIIQPLSGGDAVLYVVQDDPPVLYAIDAIAPRQHQPLWTYNFSVPTGEYVDIDAASPVVAGGKIFASTTGTGHSGLYVLDSADRGKLLASVEGTAELGERVSAPAVGGQANALRVYVTGRQINSTKKGWLQAFTSSGTRQFRAEVAHGVPIPGAPAVSTELEHLYVSTCKMRAIPRVIWTCAVSAFSLANGTEVWTRDIGEVPPPRKAEDDAGQISTPVITGDPYSSVSGMVFVAVSQGGGCILSLSAETGQVIWNYTVGAANEVSHSVPVVFGELVLVTRANPLSEYLIVLDALNGKELYTAMVANGVSPHGCQETTHPHIDCGGCYDREKRDRCPPSAPSVDDFGNVYVGSLDGSVFAFQLPSSDSSDPRYAPQYVAYMAVGGGIVIVIGVLAFRTCPRKRPRYDSLPRSGDSNLHSPSPSSRASVGPGTAQPPPGVAGVGYGSAQRYRVVQKLGSGAYGVVYLVRRVTDGERFAMKYIPCESAEDREEALNEWQTVSRLPPHPNLIRVLSTFMNWHEEAALSCSPSVAPAGSCQADEQHELPADATTDGLLEGALSARGMNSPGYVCIVMPFMQEGDLRGYIMSYRGGVIPEKVILSYTGQIASLLSVIHARSLLHRDLKPENILLADEAKRVVVTDFGLARQMTNISYCRSHAGSLAFIAPETWERQYSTEVDVWALGCIAYAMATLRVERHNVRCLWREATDPQFRAGIVAEVRERGYGSETEALICAALSPSRKQRPGAPTIVQALYKHIPAGSREACGVASDEADRAAARKQLFDSLAAAAPSGKVSPTAVLPLSAAAVGATCSPRCGSERSPDSNPTAHGTGSRCSQEAPSGPPQQQCAEDPSPSAPSSRHASIDAWPPPAAAVDFMS